MTDPATIKIINAARDVLVGKVPDPKAQVEQITTAMMYKFMDDMDQKSSDFEDWEKSFFIGKYEKYSWSNLFNLKFSAQEKYDLYCEAIKNLQKNPNFPQLFRNMFKGAFLPYTDPRTLRLFLTEINKFTYNHSENLGCAFEYLLSILGSQGDAGQFRTPRHIIDFMVEAIDPKKGEKILDPACGTAGFLISAYKHILKTNYEPNEKQTKINNKKTIPLTSDEKKTLSKNIYGYDISPEMVKLSLVNLFLHKFLNPQIHEYDTLTSQRKWNDYFDVIFANPPFMTPKGGIQPHDKFSVQAKRAEVLFVSYIAEHLKNKGRAGIVVPEGIIFQSANAYKELRKMLVENWGLYAVVSLPSGVFQPYSGVKTSILLIDQKFAKTAKNILFIKIENDGYSFGTQRKKTNKNDIPEALKILKEWKKTNKLLKSNIAHKVLKSEIMKNEKHIFIGSHYQLQNISINTKWNWIHLKKFLSKKKYPDIEKNIYKRLSIRCHAKGIVIRTVNELILEKTEKSIIFARKAGQFVYGPHFARGQFGIVPKHLDNYCLSGVFHSFDIDQTIIFPEFLNKLFIFKYSDFLNLEIGSTFPRVDSSTFLNYKIPLPPLAIQKQIVEEVESYQKVIDGAKQAVENWKPSFKIDPKWPLVTIEKICQFLTKNKGIAKWKRKIGKFPYYGASGIIDYVDSYIFDEQLVIVGKDGSRLLVKENQNAFIAKGKYWANEHTHILKLNSNKIIDYFFVKILNLKDLTKFVTKSVVPNLRKSSLATIEISLPSLAIQKQIVEEIKIEENAVEGMKLLIEKMKRKIRIKIEEVWKDNS